MENTSARLMGEIAFYVAMAVLIIMFGVKKYRQLKNTQNDNQNNK